MYGEKLGRVIDPDTEVLITNGSNGAMIGLYLSLLQVDEEVVVFQPCFPSYYENAWIANGRVRFVQLEWSGES